MRNESDLLNPIRSYPLRFVQRLLLQFDNVKICAELYTLHRTLCFTKSLRHKTTVGIVAPHRWFRIFPAAVTVWSYFANRLELTLPLRRIKYER